MEAPVQGQRIARLAASGTLRTWYHSPMEEGSPQRETGEKELLQIRRPCQSRIQCRLRFCSGTIPQRSKLISSSLWPTAVSSTTTVFGTIVPLPRPR